MMDKLLAGSPVGDEIAFGYEVAIEGHGAEKQDGKENRQRAWDSDQKHTQLVLIFKGGRLSVSD